VPKGRYYFASKAGSKFGEGMGQEHRITVQVMDGGKWSGKIEIKPNHVCEYVVSKGVTKNQGQERCHRMVNV